MFNHKAALNDVFLKVSGLTDSKPSVFDLTAVFACIESGKAPSFTQRENFLLQRSIMNDILVRAKATGQNTYNKRSEFTGVKLDLFGRQINSLVQLGRALSFSDNMRDWVQNRQKVLAQRLARQHDYNDLSRVWVSMDENGRESFLLYLMKTQHAIFSDDTASFAPCNVIKRDLLGNMLAGFIFEDHGIEGNTRPLMLLNPPMLRETGLQESIIGVVHEGIHSIVRQLGMLTYHKLIPESHPLYADGKLMADRIEIMNCETSIFGPVYGVDFEEKLTHATHESFIPLYLEQVKMRRQNRVSIAPRHE